MVKSSSRQQSSVKGKAHLYDAETDNDFMPPAPNEFKKEKRKRGELRPKMIGESGKKGKKGVKPSVGIRNPPNVIVDELCNFTEEQKAVVETRM